MEQRMFTDLHGTWCATEIWNNGCSRIYTEHSELRRYGTTDVHGFTRNIVRYGDMEQRMFTD